MCRRGERSSVISSAFNIAVSGMNAQMDRMRAISSNIANVHTTRGEGGKPFARQDVRFSEQSNGGVSSEIVRNPSTRLAFDPSHPDARTDGMVEMPDVDIPTEMVRAVESERIFEANTKVVLVSDRMEKGLLDILA